MKEIGGYFELEQFTNREYYPDLIAVNNARNALLFLIRARKIKKIHLPFFLCDSVSSLCKREGVCFEYYHIERNFLPCFEKELQDGEWLYVVNYYGQIAESAIVELKKRYDRVIFDNVQAFFARPIRGIDTLYSCRKFFGVPDGGYLSTTAEIDEEVPTDTSGDRMKHLLGRFEGSASDYYADFKANDHSFVELPLRYMSKLTHNILGAIDYDQTIQKRNQNWAYLHSALGARNPLSLRYTDGPYAYPFYCENGSSIKKKLAEKKIFVATLWPNVFDVDGCDLEKDYAANILPLPCDQRYGIEEMQYLVEEVLKCIN